MFINYIYRHSWEYNLRYTNHTVQNYVSSIQESNNQNSFSGNIFISSNSQNIQRIEKCT
jgi:hypothetical protein